MPAVRKLPHHYVKYLCKPGLSCNVGTVSLQMYMGAHKNGANAAKLFDALTASPVIKDTDSGEAACAGFQQKGAIPADEWAIMRKGQGNDVYFQKFWNWLWDNQEQLRDSNNSALKEIYGKYFASGSKGAIQSMVNDAYFGMECIGFVSNYLRHAGIWKKYFGVDNHHWRIHFPNAVNSPRAIAQLDLLEWETYGHVALIDQVYDPDGSGRVHLAVSQCSGFKGGLVGPMSTDDAYLTASGNVGGETLYTVSGDGMPVQGDVKVRRMPGLVYMQPDRPGGTSVFPVAEDVRTRAG